MKPFAPEANALSRLSYGRIGNSVAEPTACGAVHYNGQPSSALFCSQIRQVLGSNRTTEFYAGVGVDGDTQTASGSCECWEKPDTEAERGNRHRIHNLPAGSEPARQQTTIPSYYPSKRRLVADSPQLIPQTNKCCDPLVTPDPGVFSGADLVRTRRASS